SGNVCLSILRQLITYLSENDIPTEDPETEERLLQILEQSADSPNYTPPPWNDIIETILKLLKALPTPCALILDDLQRCGLPIYHLLSRIADTLTAAPIYILLTYDAKELAVTPENAALGKLPCFKRIFEHTITLEPLSDPQMEAMLKTYWQIEPALSDRIIGRSFGNPFYATALIQHLGQTARLIKREDGHFGLDESDTQSLGVPYIVSQFLHQRLDEILLSMGTVADLYREILIRLAAFGHHMFLQELEAFWKFDEDQALASRWRDAIKAWCAAGMLVYAQSEDQAADTLEFSTPWHADVIQAVLPKSRLRSLKSQVALALIDCYTEPTYEQCYRIALFWRGARDAVSYIQCCQQSADQAFEKGALVFALDRYDELIEVFDEMLAMSAPAPSVLHAIEWPQCLISAADITLRLNKFKEFEAHTARLKAWIDKYTEPVYLAYYQLLNAKKSLRNDNYSHAAELAELARDSFAICHDTRHVIQSQIVLADASTRMGNITAAQKHLNTALETLQAGDSSDELAAIQIRLARLELFAGNITRAGTLANAACIRFKNAGLTLDLADADLSRKMIAFLTAPNRDALAALQKSIDTLTQQGDKFATAKAQTCLLVANALADEWETVEHQCQMLLSDNAELPPAIVSGTITLMQALLAAVHGDRFNAINELTMAIACYGPKHRRARAWCHTLSGLNDMMSRNYKHGTQALDRALNDFQALEDQFGVTCVRIAYCALDAICGNSQTIHDRYHRASSALQERDLPIQRALLNALAAFLAKSSSAPERFPMLPDEKPVALPAFFTHTGLQMIQAALHPAPPKAEAQNQNIAQEHDTPSYTSSELDI
ncbi:MAG: hypothetical protein IKY83_11290, partial [Proteobacteria bacterium]|nr:hypothetical protein [Pseudomonadota bacterium]